MPVVRFSELSASRRRFVIVSVILAISFIAGTVAVFAAGSNRPVSALFASGKGTFVVPLSDEVKTAPHRASTFLPSVPPPPPVVLSPPQKRLSIGYHREFWVEVGSGANGAPLQSALSATLVAQQRNVDVYIADDLLATVPEEQRSHIAALVQTAFDETTRYFGLSLSYRRPSTIARYCIWGGARMSEGPRYINSGGELFSFLIVRADAMFAAGYPGRNDYLVQNAAACSHWHSNEIPALGVHAWVLDKPLQENIEQLIPEDAAHLVAKHLMIVGRSFAWQAAFVREGLAVLAQDFTMRALNATLPPERRSAGSARAYLQKPYDYAFISADPLFPSGNRELYGGAYLLQRYLFDRYGLTYLRTVASSMRYGGDAVEQGTGERFDDVIADFATAVYDAAGKPGQSVFEQTVGPVQLGIVDQNASTTRVLGGSIAFLRSQSCKPQSAVSQSRVVSVVLDSGCGGGTSPSLTGCPPDKPVYATMKVTPDMPEDARNAHAAGTVIVEVHVDTTGNVTSANVERSVNKSLDDATMAAARESKYGPAIQNCVPVPGIYRYVVTFES